MAGVNKAIVVGNLGADPEVRYTQGGQAVANFRMATTDNWTDKSGQKQERTEWHRIVAWGKTAELCGEYLTKGRQVYIEGRLQTREWTDKENHKNYTTEIVADKVVFLSDGRGQGQGGGGGLHIRDLRFQREKHAGTGCPRLGETGRMHPPRG